MSDAAYRHIRTSTDQGVLVLTVLQEKLASDQVAEELRQELVTAMAQAGTQKVVIDMSAVHYVGSNCVRPFLLLRKQLQDAGGRPPVLCRLHPVVDDIFRTLRLIEGGRMTAVLLDKAEDVPAAVAKLNAAAAG